MSTYIFNKCTLTWKILGILFKYFNPTYEGKIPGLGREHTRWCFICLQRLSLSPSLSIYTLMSWAIFLWWFIILNIWSLKWIGGRVKLRAHLNTYNGIHLLLFINIAIWRSLEVLYILLIIHVLINIFFLPLVFGVWIVFLKVWFLLVVLWAGRISHLWKDRKWANCHSTRPALEHILKMCLMLPELRDNGSRFGVLLTDLWLGEKYGLLPLIVSSSPRARKAAGERQEVNAVDGCLTPDIMSKNTSTERQAYARALVWGSLRLCFLLYPSKFWSEELNYSRSPASVWFAIVSASSLPLNGTLDTGLS